MLGAIESYLVLHIGHIFFTLA